MRRLALIMAAAASLTAGSPSDGASQTAACGLYCDVIDLACRKSIGWLDLGACHEWHEGCLDGCRAFE